VKEKFDEIDIKKLRGNFEKRDVHYEIKESPFCSQINAYILIADSVDN
jgi:hypothetical protein